MLRWKNNLATKFVLTAVVVTLVPMLIVGAIGYSLGRQGIRTHTALHLETAVALKAEQVLGWLDQQRAVVGADLYPGDSTETVDRLLNTEPGTVTHDEAASLIDSHAMHNIAPLLSGRLCRAPGHRGARAVYKRAAGPSSVPRR